MLDPSIVKYIDSKLDMIKRDLLFDLLKKMNENFEITTEKMKRNISIKNKDLFTKLSKEMFSKMWDFVPLCCTNTL